MLKALCRGVVLPVSQMGTEVTLTPWQASSLQSFLSSLSLWGVAHCPTHMRGVGVGSEVPPSGG